ncbi:MAG TPA: VWA domain-containing protein [Bryobacteraceae bacterium]|nr:VWA domain-containing protein [Bryobacteraceae bacterium]
MRLLRLTSQTLFAVAAFAQTQQPAPQQPPQQSSSQDSSIELGQPIKVEVTNIVAPVLVTDNDGNIVNGLQPNQFHLFDNGKEQNIQVDVTYEPISLVIAIQCSARLESILPQIRHLGSMVQTMIGTQGEAAVLKFDGRIMVTQDFTTDVDKLKLAITRIQPGSSGSRMIDAVDRGVYLLRNRPKNQRRVILLVSETRDEGSETRLRTALIDANLQNVLIYTVDITQLAVRLTEKQVDMGPTRRDPTVMNAPLGIANTPTTMEQNYGMQNRAQFVPLLKEIYVDAKGIFVRDPATQFARSTGGHEFYFLKQKGLEDAVQQISTEIRSHYMISYKPSNSGEGGYHTIAVSIDRSNLICKTRPGYYIGGGKN